MYEFLILAQLSRRPMHGYMIAKIINNMMGPFQTMPWGALYPVLNRLVQTGMIQAEEAEADEDGRPKKVYSITEAGRKRLHEHLMDTERHLADYATVFTHKVAFFHLLTPEEQRFLTRHYVVYTQQHVAHLDRKRDDLCQLTTLTPLQRQDILRVIDHRREFWEGERAWAEQLIENQRIEEAI